ncbi:Bug family tripartite tricarboxylate transporter substrate binding protein [Falsiroseomonas sp.]|uniref:Bug family tripartite tricarboxylate transporter substrate binding protein n=1 Tax=Falsiroseomonas sp. TaxID=2870721 RepID=UPI00356468B4
MTKPPPLTRRHALAAAAALATLPAPRALAQAYPARPVRLVVPFPPGNTSDILARMVAEEVQKRLGATIVVENRPGASGALGVQAVTGARPDGLTLLVTTQSPIVVNPPLLKNPPYDPVRDLSPVALFARTGFILIAAPDFPANTMADAARVLRAAPAGTYSAANPGLGTMSHLAMALIGLALGTQVVSVPYRGSAAALVDVTAGRVPLMIDGFNSAVPQVRGGKAKALAVVARRRSPLVPDVPSMAEAGVPELAEIEALSWTGLLAPAGTPPEVAGWWTAALRSVMGDAAVVAKLAQTFIEAVPPVSAEAFAQEIAADLAKWTRVVREARIEQQ